MKLVDLSFNKSRLLKNNIGIYKIVLEVEKFKITKRFNYFFNP